MYTHLPDPTDCQSVLNSVAIPLTPTVILASGGLVWFCGPGAGTQCLANAGQVLSHYIT